MITTNPHRTAPLINALIPLWERSVRATHHFLTEEDIQHLTPLVREGVLTIETLIVAYDNDQAVAFMGLNVAKMDASKIEMLFVSPQYFGKGIGKKLVTLAITHYGVQYVDVNEQNPQAIGFYQHMGFEVGRRIACDEQGNPFPILKMKRCPFSIRRATTDDIVQLRELFQRSVLTINSRDYSQAEVEDWASCGNDLSRWKTFTETHYFIVAQNPQSQIIGFSSITPKGYLHSMFVHPDFQGRGVATLLLKNIERYAIENDITEITSEVSLTARPLFEKQGYIVQTEQKRQAKQLYLTNFRMVKSPLNQ